MAQDEQAERAIQRGMAWLGAANVFTHIVDLAALVAVLAVLTPRQLGLATAIRAVQSVLEAAGGTGLGASVAIVQVRGVGDAGARGVLLYGALIGLVFAGGFVALQVPMEQWFGAEDVALLTALAAPRFVLMGASVAPLGMLHRQTDYRTMAICESGANAVAAIARGGLALAGFGAAALVLARTIQAAVLLILALSMTTFRVVGPVAMDQLRAVARYGRRVTGALVGDVMQRYVDYLVVGRMLDLELLGVYRAAYDVASEPVQPLGDLGVRSGGPVFARLAERGGDLSRALAALLRPLLLVAGLVGAAIFVLADEVMGLFADGAYVGGITCARLLIVASLGRIVLQQYQPLFEWTGEGRAGTRLSLLAVACLVASLALSITWGGGTLNSVGVGWILALPVPLLAGWWMQRRRFQIELRVVVGAMLPALVCTLLALGAGSAAALLRFSMVAPFVEFVLRFAMQLVAAVFVFLVAARLLFSVRLGALVSAFREQKGEGP
ncbi:MAG: oligosaccharide flippase family protein [Myxococcota bacterium]